MVSALLCCREVKGMLLANYAASHGANMFAKPLEAQRRAMKAVVATWLEVVEVSWIPDFSFDAAVKAGSEAV